MPLASRSTTSRSTTRKDLWRIWAVIYVERDSQKGIIIGKGGEVLKAIGIEAREDLERLLGGEGVPRT